MGRRAAPTGEFVIAMLGSFLDDYFCRRLSAYTDDHIYTGGGRIFAFPSSPWQDQSSSLGLRLMATGRMGAYGDEVEEDDEADELVVARGVVQVD